MKRPAGMDKVRNLLGPASAAGRLYRAYLRWAYSNRRRARTKLFRAFALENRWGDPDTLSGRGSNLEQTRAIREELPTLWADLGIRRLADVPCGDFFWMSRIADRLDYYFGGELVPELVAIARDRALPHCEFGVFDLLTDDFPPVDAILVRDVLTALSDRDAETALRNVARSSARYLITTTFPNAPSQDIVTGGWRALNLNAPPFELPAPLRLIDEQCTVAVGFADKSLGVWEIDRLRDRFGHLA